MLIGNSVVLVALLLKKLAADIGNGSPGIIRLSAFSAMP